MIVAFPPDVRERLDRIEAEEGIPAAEIVHQAVAVWSYLSADDRKAFGVLAMRAAIARILGDDR